MGIFAGLDTEAYDRQYKDTDLIRRLVRYFNPHRRSMFILMGLMALWGITGLALPIGISRAVDLLPQQNGYGFIWLVFGLVLGAGLFNYIANWFRRRIISRVVGDVVQTWRSDAFSAAAHHDLSFFDRFSSGRIVSRITSDTTEFGNMVVLVTDLFTQFIESSILTVVLLYTEWRLALVLFAFLPVPFLVAVGFRWIARKVTQRGMRAMANVNAAIKETVSGIAVAKNFRQEASIYKEFETANLQSLKVNVQRGFVLSIVFPLLNALAGVGTAILVMVGGNMAAQSILDPAAANFVSAGSWYLFLVSLDRFWFPVLNLSAFWAQIQSGLSAAERVFALIDAESAVRQTDSQPVESVRGEIQFEDVHFSYSEKEPVLQGFDLHIQPGETIALVGHTGAGKSSIAKLVARFYEFQQGRILIDGQDIRQFNLASYRRHLGIVSQTPFLFSGTIAENIRYARPEIGDEAMEQLARQMGGGDWLDTLPDGLHSEVGERGGRLSMGQRQLVALLRVLVQHPAIFILDEATASIDPFTERQIQQTVDMILRQSTSILIAHRLSTVMAADRIIVLQKGRIIEHGSHASLMAAGGHYAELYNTYFRHQSLEYIENARKGD